MFTLEMRRIVLTLALIAGTIAVKLLTTSDDIKEYQEGTGAKLEIEDINSQSMRYKWIR